MSPELLQELLKVCIASVVLAKPLLQLLRRLMQEEDAKRYFNEAVDPDALGIPEYRTIIKALQSSRYES